MYYENNKESIQEINFSKQHYFFVKIFEEPDLFACVYVKSEVVLTYFILVKFSFSLIIPPNLCKYLDISMMFETIDINFVLIYINVYHCKTFYLIIIMHRLNLLL